MHISLMITPATSSHSATAHKRLCDHDVRDVNGNSDKLANACLSIWYKDEEKKMKKRERERNLNAIVDFSFTEKNNLFFLMINNSKFFI